MTTQPVLPEPVLVPRHITGPLVEHLHLRQGVLGEAFVQFQPDPAYSASIVQWWSGMPPTQQIPREWIATLAAPVLVTDIRALYGAASELQTWALASGLDEKSLWLMLAPVSDGKDYHIQPVPAREWLVNTFMGYLESGGPVWESPLKVKLPITEFALLLALTDMHSKRHHASMILHELVPNTISFDELMQSWENATRFADPRYLLPFCAHMLNDKARTIPLNEIPGLAGQLVQHGLLSQDGNGYAWSEVGLFLAEALHRRICALAIDIAGAAQDGVLGTQGAMFVRSDQPLFYFDIDSQRGTVLCAGVSKELARKLLNEVFTPVGIPPAKSVAPPPPVYQAPPPPQPVYQPPAPTPVYQAPAPAAPMPAPTAAFCPQCGTRLTPGQRFCAGCGAAVG